MILFVTMVLAHAATVSTTQQELRIGACFEFMDDTVPMPMGNIELGMPKYSIGFKSNLLYNGVYANYNVFRFSNKKYSVITGGQVFSILPLFDTDIIILPSVYSGFEYHHKKLTIRTSAGVIMETFPSYLHMAPDISFFGGVDLLFKKKR